MEYLHDAEINALLRVAYSHNKLHHLALLVMYATGTRVSQALRLTGFDIIPDKVAGGHKIRMPKAKRGFSRTFPIIKSEDPIRDMSPLVELAPRRGSCMLFGGLDRHYLHRCIKKYAREAGLHGDMVHAHTLRHSTAMRIWEQTHRAGAITGYLCHTDQSSVYPYLRENDAAIGDDVMAAVLTAPAAA
jgi:integrase